MIDALRERKAPFNPDDVVREYTSLCRSYGVSRVFGDRYAGMWTEERFQVHGVRYVRAELTKSDLYAALLGQLNSVRVQLPDSPRLVSQLVGLERRVSRGGRDSIDHAPNTRDDLANSVAGVVHLLLGKRPGVIESFDPRTSLGWGVEDSYEARWARWEKKLEQR